MESHFPWYQLSVGCFAGQNADRCEGGGFSLFLCPEHTAYSLTCQFEQYRGAIRDSVLSATSG